eukprot:SAG22_NODE_484_length_9912_cov_23.425150_4_plen_97_part_00
MGHISHDSAKHNAIKALSGSLAMGQRCGSFSVWPRATESSQSSLAVITGSHHTIESAGTPTDAPVAQPGVSGPKTRSVERQLGQEPLVASQVIRPS